MGCLRVRLDYHPLQEAIDKTGTICDFVQRPHLDSISDPLPYRLLRYRFVVSLFGDEVLELVQDPEIPFGCFRSM